MIRRRSTKRHAPQRACRRRAHTGVERPGNAVATIVLLVAVLLANPARAATPEGTLVMPFDNVDRQGKIYWITEASAVLLSEDLENLGSPTISREERLKAFERLNLPAAASLSDATILKVGELVGAAEVVHGTLALDGDELTVRARRVRLDAGRLEADVVERGRLDDLFRLFDRVAARLVKRTADPGPTEHGPLAAFENYIKGLLAGTPEGQIKFLKAALAQHPGFDAARLALWQAYTLEGEHKLALAAAVAVAETSRLYRRARFLAARSQIQLRQYDAATETLNALLAAGPVAGAYNNIGVIQLRRGNVPPSEAATRYFNKAREIDADEPDYQFNLGYAYMLEHDPQAAIYWLREAVRRDPADGDAHYVLGVMLINNGATAEGTREKELALRLSSVYGDWAKRPSSDPVPHGLERVTDDLEPPLASRPDMAFVTAEQRDQRELAAFHLERGRRLFQQEDDREAIVELGKSLYLLPYQAEAHLLIGRIYLRTGRLHDAIDAMKISLWSEETAAGHLALAEAYVQAKDLAAAKAEAQRALALDPNLAEARTLLEKLEKIE